MSALDFLGPAADLMFIQQNKKTASQQRSVESNLALKNNILMGVLGLGGSVGILSVGFIVSCGGIIVLFIIMLTINKKK